MHEAIRNTPKIAEKDHGAMLAFISKVTDLTRQEVDRGLLLLTEQGKIQWLRPRKLIDPFGARKTRKRREEEERKRKEEARKRRARRGKVVITPDSLRHS